MTKNESLYKLLHKYTSMSKMEWCCVIYNNILDEISIYDLEAHKERTVSYLLKILIDNNDLETYFDDEELKDFYDNIPKQFKKGEK